MAIQNFNLRRSGQATINRVWSSSSAMLSKSLGCVQPERMKQAMASQVGPLPATVISRGLNAARQAISTTFFSPRSQEYPNLTCKSDGSLNIIFNDGGLSDLYGDQPKIVLAVLGMTGVGKSTFIKYATGLQHIEVGEGLESCTPTVMIYSVPGTNIFLLDTPGFGDTYKSDADILSAIANALGDFHEDSTTTVNGIIYIHAMDEARMGHLALKNLRMFQNLIGEEHLEKCCLLKTKWKSVPDAKAALREKELMNNKEFWQPLIALGAKVERFDDSKEGALKIIHSLADLEGFVPQVTRQYTVENQSLHQTAAGRIVDNGIEELKDQQRGEIEEMRKKSEKEVRAKNIEVAALIDKEREAKERELSKLKVEQAKIQRTREDQFRQREREREAEFEQLQRGREEQMRLNEREKEAEFGRLREETERIRRGELRGKEKLLQEIEQQKRKYEAEAEQERRRYDAEIQAQRDLLLKTREQDEERNRTKSTRNKSRLGRWVTRAVGAAYVVGVTVMTGGLALPIAMISVGGLEMVNQVQKEEEAKKLGYC